MEITRRRWVAWCGAASLAFALAGCGGAANETAVGPAGPGGGSGSGPKLMFITNSNADWWDAVEKGMQDGGKEFGAQVVMRRNEGTTQGQIDRLQDALSAPDLKGVAVSVIEADAPGVADAMRELQKAGKVVIAIDSDIVPSAADARSAYIGTNNVKAGEEAGKAAKALRPSGGKVAIFVGTSGAANARERKQGFFQGAGSAFKEIETFDDGGDHSRARDNVQTALAKYSDLGVLLGLWSYNAPAVAEEVSKAPDVRKRTTVVTFDLDQLAVSHLEKGEIDVSVCQNPYEMGYQGVHLLKALIDGDKATAAKILPDGQTRDTGVRVIVPKADSPVKGDNVITIDEMKSWLASKGLKSS